MEESKSGATTTTTYAYDVFGNKITEQLSGAQNASIRYHYNDLNQLTAKTGSDGIDVRYDYDTDGNLQ